MLFPSSFDLFILFVTAVLIMELTPPAGGENTHLVDDLCWLDDHTMVIVQGEGKQVLMASIDTATNTSKFHVIDSGYMVSSVSCAPDGKSFYAVDISYGQIKVYYRAGEEKIWKGLSGASQVAVNLDFVVVGRHTGGHVSVYKRGEQFLYNMSTDGERLIYTHLTQDNLFLALARSDHDCFLNIRNLKDNKTVILERINSGDGWLIYPYGVASAGKFILVSAGLPEGIYEYSSEGEFLHKLQFVRGEVSDPGTIAVTPHNHFLAIQSGDRQGKIRIYRIS